MTCASNAMPDEFHQRTCEDPGRASSALAEELLCRLHGLRAEIVVPDAGESHEAFGRVDQVIEPLRQRHRHDSVALACNTSTGAVTLPMRKSERN